jgi:hypothetical protein
VKRFLLLVAIVLLALAGAGFSDGGDAAQASPAVDVCGPNGNAPNPTCGESPIRTLAGDQYIDPGGGGSYYCRPDINGLVATLHPSLPPERCGYGFHYNPYAQWTSAYGWEFGCGASYANCWKWEYA